MAKKKNRGRANSQADVEIKEAEQSPSFEIGVKGDDFDRKYRRAAKSETVPADRLLSELSRESRADKYNFMGFAIPALLIFIIALSLTIISRGDIEEMLSIRPSPATVISGAYTQNLNEVFEDTVPFKNAAAKLCAALGLCEKPAPEPEEPLPGEVDVPFEPEPVVTQPTTAETEPSAAITSETEQSVTSAPEPDLPVTVTTTEETEPETYETYIMYATGTLNIRLGPSTEDAILGYFSQNEPIDVIQIRDDGWAEILYNGMKVYAYAEYMSDSEVEVTTTRRRSRTDATTEPEPDETDVPDEDSDVTTAPDEDEGDVTSPEDGGEDELSDDDVDVPDESETLGGDGGSDETDGSSENGEPW